ncbi:hypothetical protein BGW80DRAFT_1462941 [Lactifluus volemus]|nr:hypothetical protein BGW80DRAFT_1462941 [Lactifluus volemus]
MFDPQSSNASGRERDWLPAHVIDGTDDDDEIPAPAAAGTHATPDATDGDPEADMDPTIMIPPRTSSIDLASHHHKRTSKSKRKLPTQLCDARLDPLRLLPHYRFLLFRWHPHRAIRIRALLPTLAFPLLFFLSVVTRS